MKSQNFVSQMTRILLVVFFCFFFIAILAHAGIWQSIKTHSLSVVAKAVIAGVFFITGAFGLGKVFHWKKVANEGVDVIIKIYKSMQPDSPGGKSITKEEIEDILKEGGEFGIAVFQAFRKKHLE